VLSSFVLTWSPCDEGIVRDSHSCTLEGQRFDLQYYLDDCFSFIVEDHPEDC